MPEDVKKEDVGKDLEELRKSTTETKEALEALRRQVSDPNFLASLYGVREDDEEELEEDEEEGDEEEREEDPKRLVKKTEKRILSEVEKRNREAERKQAELLRIQQEIADFARKHDDFDDYRDWMILVGQRHPEIEVKGLQALYDEAKRVVNTLVEKEIAKRKALEAAEEAKRKGASMAQTEKPGVTLPAGGGAPQGPQSLTDALWEVNRDFYARKGAGG